MNARALSCKPREKLTIIAVEKASIFFCLPLLIPNRSATLLYDSWFPSIHKVANILLSTDIDRSRTIKGATASQSSYKKNETYIYNKNFLQKNV